MPIEFQIGVIEQLSFPDQTFDVVLSTLMMHHLPTSLKHQGLAEIARVLKPGGRLVIADFTRKQDRQGWAARFHAGGSSIHDLVALVSDALAAAGVPPGPCVLGNQSLVSDGHVVRHADGTLAGCAQLLDHGVRNVRSWLPAMPPAKLIDMATRTPANLLGLPRKGRVAVGCDADLIVLDAGFNVRSTFVRGKVVRAQPSSET